MARGIHPEGAPEAIVIGSGFGGAVAACRLAQDGYRVLVIERGRRFEQGDFPALPTEPALLPDIKRWSWPVDHGLWDVVDLKEVVSVQAAGYGGGSLVYANVHLRPPPHVFDDHWPVAYRGRKGLDTYFDLAATMLEVQPATRHPDFKTFSKSKELEEVATRLGRKAQFFYPPLAVTFKAGPNAHGVQQNACTACGRCSTGCPEKAKNTLDHNYLALAERHGAKVLTECEVSRFVELPDGRFRVDCIDHLEGHTVSYETKYVFICAGSVHSTRLLARAELAKSDVKKRVGVGYFPGGDALGMIFDTKKPLHPEMGPTITATVVHNEDGDHEGRGRFFLVQDGGYSNELARMLGTVRAPAWVGRNRLSKAEAPQVELPPPGTDEFQLPSPLDDVLSAVQGGLGSKLASSQLRAAWPKLVSELKDPLLLPAIVDNTIDASIRARYARWWLTRHCDPNKPFLSFLIDLERKVIARWFGNSDALAEHALNAVLSQGGLKTAQVAQQMFGYDARGAAHRTMLLAMGRDAAPGVLQYDEKTDTLVADLDLYHLARGYSNEELLMTDIAHELGGELRTNPAWAFLGKPITVHNQGGCRMSDQSEYGVTDPNGAVHGYDTLFVLDGAVLCTSVGVNPSATITAIAERNVERFLKTHAPERANLAGRAEYQRQRALAAGFGERARDFPLEPPELPTVPFRAKPLGLRFDESMTGYYLPGSDPPPDNDDDEFRARERQGRPAHPLRVDLRLSSENLARFWDDETHALRATGHITLVLPGETEKRELTLTDGRVELMVPRYKPYGVPPDQRERLVAQEYALLGQSAFARLSAENRGLLGTPAFQARRHKTIAGPPPPRAERFLKYWLTFSHAGKHFLVYGYKRVKENPAIDAWRDTSTLFVSLYETGKDYLKEKDPDVSALPDTGFLGAGVIHVDMNEFMFKQLPSMFVAEGIDPVRPAPGMPSKDDPDAVDPARATWAIAKFGWFFFGSLQRVYAPELGKVFETFFRLSEGSRPQ